MAQLKMYLLTIAVILMIDHCTGCFITNCPPGGKRSILAGPNSSQFRKECTRCGPALTGRCYGPNICCSPLLGCNVGGATSARCSLEAYSLQPCYNPGSTCGPNNKGVCALNSTCCTTDGCFVDKSCIASSPEFTLQESNNF